MRYRRLGNTGLLVSELALGAMLWGEPSARSTPPAEAERLLDRYLAAGGNHLDTADVYAGGAAEEILGRALGPRRSQVILATKVRFRVGPGSDPNDQGLSRYHIQRAVEASLRRLRTDTIDLLYMHFWDALTPLEESLRAFDDLVRAGKVRYLGVSNFKAWRVMQALAVCQAQGWSCFVAAQYQYSLVLRDIESELADLCRSEGVGLVPWGPLGGGFLSGKYRRDQRPGDAAEGRLAVTPDGDEESWARRATEHNWRILAAVETIVATRPGVTCAQVALAWLLAQPGVASVLLGARTLAQLDDNLGAADLSLTAAELAALDAAS